MKIELIKWSEEYLDDISRIYTNVDRSFLSDAIPMPYTKRLAKIWMEITVQPKEGKEGLFRIIQIDGKNAGEISIECKNDVYRRDADIGYVLLPEYSGRGVMTEAIRMLCAEAFEALNLLRITARVFSPNAASRRVLEKNGFVLEGTMRRAVCKGEEVYDLCLYGKLREKQG